MLIEEEEEEEEGVYRASCSMYILNLLLLLLHYQHTFIINAINVHFCNIIYYIHTNIHTNRIKLTSFTIFFKVSLIWRRVPTQQKN